MLSVLLRALAAHGVPLPPEGPKQKEQVIKALLNATKKRRILDIGSDEDGAGGRAESACDIDAEVDDSSCSEITLTASVEGSAAVQAAVKQREEAARMLDQAKSLERK
eukprot:5027779-Pleurochrysis_carterae.AAC.1